MFNFALAVFLLLSPIIIFPLNGFVARLQWYQFGGFNGSGNMLQLQFFQYGAMGLFLISLFSKPKRKFDNKYFGLLFGVYLWSVLCNPKTMESFFTVLSGFLIYYLVSIYADKKRMFLWIIFSVAALNTVFAILQSVGINLIYLSKTDIVGLMSYKTHLGIYQAVALPIAYFLNPFLVIIPAIGLILSKSATAIVVAIAGMLYLLKAKRKTIIISLCIISIPIIKLSLITNKFQIRWDVWKEMPMLIAKNVYGYGVGIFNYVNNGVQYDNPYSLYLGATYALGILGLAAIIFFVKNSFFNVKDISRGLVSACLILAMVGLGYSFLNYARLAGTAIVLFALLNVEKKEETLLC